MSATLETSTKSTSSTQLILQLRCCHTPLSPTGIRQRRGCIVSNHAARYGSSVPSPPARTGRQLIHAHPEFRSINAAYRRFGIVATALSVGGFLSYVLLSSFAPGVMNERLTGHLTLGLALGLAQFAVMGVTAFLYVRHMREKIDPVVRRLRTQIEEDEAERRRVPAGRRFGAW
ncbi:DUF485 domain-containing protein [Streptomyces caniscabiei]|uniref:DUF485 domain-containing protein n=1 Tax=Streptomyces TaxID=1883 RepID=UPI0029A38EDB|nr:DUF485 domain-containing protein [Streptomyces caniscabiei]MDX2600195.1 DUF485 domain-containing protein [Streptomyces caniscabiei]MDX2741568.1 DUF485 domain-containing protein [Streptomyces caniscabiei]MDX2779379.1 DUF485 domain-containing protein [Streptomyces caniscabiei]